MHLQPPLPFLPVRDVHRHRHAPARAMVGEFQMQQLVHDDILYQVVRQLEQFIRQSQRPGGGDGAPFIPHGPYLRARHGDTELLRPCGNHFVGRARRCVGCGTVRGAGGVGVLSARLRDT